MTTAAPPSFAVGPAGDVRGQLKVLLMAKRFPYPTDARGKIRTGMLLEYLSRDFEITLVSSVDPAKDATHIRRVERLCAKFHGVPWREVPKYRAAFYATVLRRLLSRYPVTVINDYSKPLVTTLARLVAAHRYDLVVCDFVQPSLNRCGIASPLALLFQHNVESMIGRRHADACRNRTPRVFWLHRWRKMERFERDWAAAAASFGAACRAVA